MKTRPSTLAAAGAIALALDPPASSIPTHGGAADVMGADFALIRMTKELKHKKQKNPPDCGDHNQGSAIIDQAKPQIAAIHHEAMQK